MLTRTITRFRLSPEAHIAIISALAGLIVGVLLGMAGTLAALSPAPDNIAMLIQEAAAR